MAGLRGACSLATLPSAAEGRREIRSWAAEATGREQQASGQFCLPWGLPSVPGWHPQAGTSTCCNARLPTYVTQENTCILQTFTASFFFIHPFNKHFLGGLLLLGQLGHGPRTTKRTLALAELVSE